MKSVMLGLFVVASLAWSRDRPAALAVEPKAGYELTVAGAVSVATRGSAEFGAAGSSAEPAFTISLGGQDGAAAVLFTKAGYDPTVAGTYPVGESALVGPGFSAVVITGTPSHPTGVFQVQRGTIVITSASDGRIAGRFEVSGTGFLTARPADENREITATGTFAALTGGRGQELTLNDGGAR